MFCPFGLAVSGMPPFDSAPHDAAFSADRTASPCAVQHFESIGPATHVRRELEHLVTLFPEGGHDLLRLTRKLVDLYTDRNPARATLAVTATGSLEEKGAIARSLLEQLVTDGRDSPDLLVAGEHGVEGGVRVYENAAHLAQATPQILHTLKTKSGRKILVSVQGAPESPNEETLIERLLSRFNFYQSVLRWASSLLGYDNSAFDRLSKESKTLAVAQQKIAAIIEILKTAQKAPAMLAKSDLSKNIVALVKDLAKIAKGAAGEMKNQMQNLVRGITETIRSVPFLAPAVQALRGVAVATVIAAAPVITPVSAMAAPMPLAPIAAAVAAPAVSVVTPVTALSAVVGPAVAVLATPQAITESATPVAVTGIVAAPLVVEAKAEAPAVPVSTAVGETAPGAPAAQIQVAEPASPLAEIQTGMPAVAEGRETAAPLAAGTEAVVPVADAQATPFQVEPATAVETTVLSLPTKEWKVESIPVAAEERTADIIPFPQKTEAGGGAINPVITAFEPPPEIIPINPVSHLFEIIKDPEPIGGGHGPHIGPISPVIHVVDEIKTKLFSVGDEKAAPKETDGTSKLGALADKAKEVLKLFREAAIPACCRNKGSCDCEASRRTEGLQVKAASKLEAFAM